MKRALALAMAGATLTLALTGCGHGLRHAARDGNQPVVPVTVPTVQHQPAPAGPTSTAGVDADLAAVATSLADVDTQLSQATASADSDN